MHKSQNYEEQACDVLRGVIDYAESQGLPGGVVPSEAFSYAISLANKLATPEDRLTLDALNLYSTSTRARGEMGTGLPLNLLHFLYGIVNPIVVPDNVAEITEHSFS